jgi:5,10-methylenetetrahydromethanopterin reductase
MRVGLIGSGAERSLADFLNEARIAQSDGFASYWIAPDVSVDALIAVAVIGSFVPQMEFGASVEPKFLRHPMLLARQVSTVQQALGGRLMLNVAPPMPHSMQSFSGYLNEQPLNQIRQIITVLRQLLGGETVSYRGRSILVQGRLNLNVPVPPILISSFTKGMLNFAGNTADGIVTWMVGEKTLASYVVPRVNKAAKFAFRPLPRIMAAVAVCVTDDTAVAIEASRATLDDFGALASYRAMLDREGVQSPEDLLITGDEDQVGSHLYKFAVAGATDLLIAELCPDSKSERRTRSFLKLFLRSEFKPT